MDVCHNQQRHSASDPGVLDAGGRRIEIPTLIIRWGAGDLRDDWQGGGYRFCSFRCLAEWALAHAESHDGRVLVEGETPAGADDPVAA